MFATPHLTALYSYPQASSAYFSGALMDEDRWENIILGEITVLSRLNHPHAAPPPFVASFPITKLEADLMCFCTDPVPSSPAQLSLLWDGEGGKALGRPLPSPCLSPSSSMGSGDPTNPKIHMDFTKLPLQHEGPMKAQLHCPSGLSNSSC